MPSHPNHVQSVPVLNTIKERWESIMANTPGLILVAEHTTARPHPRPWYQVSALEEVTRNESNIVALAHRYEVHPDFVKAIIYMESTHGWYDRFDPWNKTIRPMNVHDTLWHQLGVSRKDLEHPDRNIAAGVHILAAIWDRTKDPTVEKVATLYNHLGATKVNVYGKTVTYDMVHKSWLIPKQLRHVTNLHKGVRKSPPEGIICNRVRGRLGLTFRWPLSRRTQNPPMPGMWSASSRSFTYFLLLIARS